MNEYARHVLVGTRCSARVVGIVAGIAAVALSVSAAVGAVAPRLPSMSGWWRFEETSGTTVADFFATNPLTTAGTPTHNLGTQVGNSIHLTTGSDYLQSSAPTGALNITTGDYSIEAWFRTSSTSTSVRTLVDHRAVNGRGYSVYLSFGHVGTQIADSTGFSNFTSPGPALWDGVWHHLGVSVERASSTGGKMYVDGVLVHTFDPTSHQGSLANAGTFRIGQAFNNSSAALNGDLDEVGIHLEALSASEVQDVYNAGVLGRSTTLPPADDARPRVLVLFDANRSTGNLAAVRDRIESSGGRVRGVFGLAGVVANVEAASMAELAGMTGVQGVYDTAIAVPPLNDGLTLCTVAAWNRLLGPPPPPEPQRQGAPETDVFPPPDLPAPGGNSGPTQSPAQPRRAAGPGCSTNGAGFNDTSLYLAGDVAVGIFYTTSGWTPASAAATFADLVYSLDQFMKMEPYARLTFVYVSEVDGSGNPVAKPSNERQYDNDLRAAWCTDWAFLIEVRNDGTWPNAFRHGPSVRLDLSWKPYTIVARHETGHIFGAGDQYCNHPPTQRFGYDMVTHGNACGNDGNGYFGGAGDNLPDLMSGWEQCYSYNDLISGPTAGQFGWHDHDGDGVLDVLTTQAVIDGPSVFHVGNPVFYGGTAIERPLLDEETYGSVSINRVTGVQYRINGLAWQDASPGDGTFNSSSEGFQFTTPVLPNGTYQVQIRASNTTGKWTAIPFSQPLVITGSSTTDARPFGVVSVTPLRAKFGTVVSATGSFSRDLETAANLLQYSFRWGDGGPFSAFSLTPNATHTYATAGTYLLEMRVRDLAGNIHTVSRNVVATPYDTYPEVVFKAGPENRHLAVNGNYSLVVSVSGSTDGETPASALEVQWDLDDDGVWDGPWSTVKTKSAVIPPLQLLVPTSPTTCAPAIVHPKSNRRRVRAQVRDSFGNITTATRFVWVVPYNHRPTAPMLNGVTFVPSGPNFIATAHASDADFSTTWDGILEYRWDFDGDGIWDTRFEPSASITVSSTANVRAQAQDRFHARVGLSPWWWSLPDPGPFAIGTVAGVFQFDVINASDVNGQLPYRISVLRPDQVLDSTSVRLNGLPPGTPVVASLPLEIDEPGSISVDLAWNGPAMPGAYRLIVEGDIDHDGFITEPLASFDFFAEAGTTTGVEGQVPLVFGLGQNFPNPFDDDTRISFVLPTATVARLEVVDLQGRVIRRLADGPHPAGRSEVHWDRRDSAGHRVAAGVYFYRLRTDQQFAKRKLVLF